jgi:DNA-binding NtrC family response regulator
MIAAPDHPTIWLVQSDEQRRAQLAAELRQDGMSVLECASTDLALEALRRGVKAAVLVTEPASGRLTDRELVEQFQDAAPRLEIIFTPAAGAYEYPAPPGAHVLVKPCGAGKLSRYIRLVAAKPALRSVLQGLYRQARASRAATPTIAQGMHPQEVS